MTPGGTLGGALPGAARADALVRVLAHPHSVPVIRWLVTDTLREWGGTGSSTTPAWSSPPCHDVLSRAAADRSRTA